MNKVTDSLTPEQQELLDSGLRMLAHMIAETHLRRVALRKAIKYTNQPAEVARHSNLENTSPETQLESCHE